VPATDDGFLIEIALIAALILINGFFAGAEIAVVAARRSRIQALLPRDRRAAAVLRLKADPDRFLATVQIGVTVVSTLASAVGGVAAIERLEPWFASLPVSWAAAVAEPLAVAVVVLAIAYLSLVVGELVPKGFAVRYAEAIAMRVARPIEWMSRASRPAVAVLTWSSRLFLRFGAAKGEPRGVFHTLDDLRAIVAEAEAQGLVRGDVISGAIEFHDRDVREVLTPRNRIDGIPVGAGLQEALRLVGESGHSRLPVFQRDLDDVLGFVYARDLYETERKGRPFDLAKVMRPALMVPASKKASALLAEMRAARAPIAVAVDEHGTTLGLVTLEDLVEVIVGKIEDEHGERPPRILRLPDGGFEVEGTVPVRDLNADEGLDLPESPGYVTVAGLVLDRLGAAPRGGETVTAGPCSLRVLEVDGHRIARLRIERAPGDPPPPAP
jgi:putative hemolysin